MFLTIGILIIRGLIPIVCMNVYYVAYQNPEVCYIFKVYKKYKK